MAVLAPPLNTVGARCVTLYRLQSRQCCCRCRWCCLPPTAPSTFPTTLPTPHPQPSPPSQPSHGSPSPCPVTTIVMVTMLNMVSTWLLVWVAALGATPTPGAEHAPTPPPEHVPTAKVQDNHKYYKLSVYQNNALKTFDENFIDMEAAEIKAGERYNYTHFILYLARPLIHLFLYLRRPHTDLMRIK